LRQSYRIDRAGVLGAKPPCGTEQANWPQVSIYYNTMQIATVATLPRDDENASYPALRAQLIVGRAWGHR